jgi:hypothetical protein
MELLYSAAVAIPFVMIGTVFVGNFRGVRSYFTRGKEKRARSRNQAILALGWLFIILSLYPVLVELINTLS